MMITSHQPEDLRMNLDVSPAVVSSDLKQLAAEMEEVLCENIVPFWLKQLDSRGGFYSLTDHLGNVDESADKGALLNSRILWFFARCARELKGSELAERCYEAAEHACRFLTEAFIDPEFGGLYWSVDQQGAVRDSQKHIYNQAFAIYALSEWYQVSQDTRVLEVIDSLYSLVERHGRDLSQGGYLEAFDRQWQPIANHLVCDTEDVVSDKSMNTHLHILEAYSRLYDIHPTNDLRLAITELLSLLCNEMQNDRFSFAQFFSRDWQVQSINHSYGHDIEGSWLLWEAAEKVLAGAELENLKQTVISMVESVYEYGLDSDGAVCNEYIENRYIDTQRIWWVQAEAVVGFVNAWQLTGRKQFLDAAFRPWSVIKTTILDRVNGDWHWEVDRSGKVNTSQPKVSFWKCPYHNGRACLEILQQYQKLT